MVSTKNNIQEETKTVKQAVFAPIYGYLLYLVFPNALGWLLLNILLSMKALSEYANIHDSILRYINYKGEQSAKRDHTQLVFNKLIQALNNRVITMVMLLVFHISLMTCRTGAIGFVLATEYIFVFFIKLFQFHKFMYYPKKEYAKQVSDPEFERDALVLSCLSLFLEVFGHILISLLSGIGYFVYTAQKNLLVIVFIFTIFSDFCRKYIGMKIGRVPFAKYVAPDMRYEAAILGVVAPTVLAYYLHQYAEKTDGKYIIKMSLYDFVTLGSQSGFLSLIGFLVLSFFKKCSGVFENLDSTSTERKALEVYLQKSALYRIWGSFKVLDFYCTIILPLMFTFWYMQTYLTKSFDEDPFEVSILKIILKQYHAANEVSQKLQE